MAVPICLVFERQADERALSRACAKTGKRMAARMAIIAMTTRSSINVNPDRGEAHQRHRIVFLLSTRLTGWTARWYRSWFDDERRNPPPDGSSPGSIR